MNIDERSMVEARIQEWRQILCSRGNGSFILIWRLRLSQAHLSTILCWGVNWV